MCTCVVCVQCIVCAVRVQCIVCVVYVRWVECAWFVYVVCVVWEWFVVCAVSVCCDVGGSCCVLWCVVVFEVWMMCLECVWSLV